MFIIVFAWSVPFLPSPEVLNSRLYLSVFFFLSVYECACENYSNKSFKVIHVPFLLLLLSILTFRIKFLLLYISVQVEESVKHCYHNFHILHIS